jgi:hypothetical protein
MGIGLVLLLQQLTFWLLQAVDQVDRWVVVVLVVIVHLPLKL